MNLITNASEAFEENEGVICVTLAHIRSGLSRFADASQDAHQNGYLRLVISDNGCGMTEDLQNRIFDPFFTTKFAGRGLGLAAVQGIIRAHGGTINVLSARDQGSHFEILLPCYGQSVRGTPETLQPASAGQGGIAVGTILIVEDEEELRIAVSKMLRKLKFSVIEASDGRTGVDLFRASQKEIDVVLLDLTLPGMTGGEVLQEVRRLRPDVAVVITTAYSKDSALTAIDKGQSWLFIRKPYRLSELADLLRSVCLRGRSSGQTAG
jgi:two-component system, cell cycle sensor histidine kinase and response regulator CckA